ncbi:thermonuclease family protein [Thiohalomonas denitrificans]|uniref:Endonuclease YncB, thermonuclease family n=1 Tax=Thiohalomonas denitrificans TaxID=415747 RepID=A0A1G5QY72_9GAMM|nr:nuclease-like protein [Thiohalomonas denitrificans]SCZ66667.1 hypothetical protein SAMN03097708_02991 [Thiohalomonas denitrificans]
MVANAFHRMLFRWVVLLSLLFGSGVYAQSFGGLGFVRDDGSIGVGNRTVYLWGIHIPLEDETCFTFMRPVRCGPRPVLALSLKVEGFIRCRTMDTRPDGSIEAQCMTDGAPFAEGEDLASFLLKNGWAMARPEAPFEYHAQERVARHRNIGIWGIPQASRPGAPNR